MKTYLGTIVSVADQCVRVRTSAGLEVDLRASTRIALGAIALIGRTVRFSVELSEATLCLTAPVLVIGSAYGLRAVGAGGTAEVTA